MTVPGCLTALAMAVQTALAPAVGIVATGGTITTDGAYTVHTFTAGGTFQITSGSGNVECLVVAGGGGGGWGNGGGPGGGAGGLVYQAARAMVAGAYTVT